MSAITDLELLALSPSDWTSIYVPFLPKDLMLDGVMMNTETTISNYFEKVLKIGKVSRVDFVQKASHTDSTAQAIFVHFSSWTMEIGGNFRAALTKHNEIKLTGYVSQTFQEHLFVSSSNSRMRRFITVKINHTPIKEVPIIPKNMHQIINNYELMEQLIEEQKTKMAEMETKMAEMAYINMRVIAKVYDRTCIIKGLSADYHFDWVDTDEDWENHLAEDYENYSTDPFMPRL